VSLHFVNPEERTTQSALPGCKGFQTTASPRKVEKGPGKVILEKQKDGNDSYKKRLFPG
jgi:hypothetical protein